MNGFPVYKTYLEVNNIPWDIINCDLDESELLPQLIENEFLGTAVTTMPLKRRRDLDVWADQYQKKIIDITKIIFPNIDNLTYTNITQEHGAWFNRYRNQGRANWHNHKSYVDLVVVWYLQASLDMGGLIIRYNDQEHVIKVNTGDVLVFPGTLYHSSEPNTSGKERFLMSNNISVTRQTIANLSREVDRSVLDQLYSKRQAEIYKLLKQL
jgi:hypothetical protein